MHDLLVDLFGHLRGMWRYRWLALVAAWAVALAGWLVVARMPDQYAATARINMDTNRVLQPLLKGVAIQPDFNQRVAMMSRMLLTRPNMEKVMRMSDLDLQTKTDQDKEAVLIMLEGKLKLEGERRNDSLYNISFTHENPELAKRVVQSLINVFVEGALGNKRQESADAQKFLDDQIKEYERRLVEAEQRRVEFNQKNMGMMPGDQGTYNQRLQETRAMQAAAELELREAGNRRDELARQLQDEPPFYSHTPETTAISPLDARIQSLQQNLDQLLLKYTEKHPDVLETKRLIADLEERKRQEAEQAVEAEEPDLDAAQVSPYQQQIKAVLSEAEAQVAALRARTAEYTQRAEALEKRLDTMLQLEAEMKQLNRDYDTLTEQHAELLKRRETARLSDEVEKSAGDVKFQVVDPPRVPIKPSAPNRILLDSGVLVAAIAVGLALALLLSLIRPVFDDGKTLNRLTGLPVLGIVSHIDGPGRGVAQRLASLPFYALIATLLVAYAAVVYLQMVKLGGM